MLIMTLFCFTSCSRAYYGALEKVGIHKRDILVDRVKEARDSQANAQEEFSSALDQFYAVVDLQETDLKVAYENMKRAYEDSRQSAREVSERIDRVSSVAEDLFAEWEQELSLYQNSDLRRSSKNQLRATRQKYEQMLSKMRTAERNMDPVLQIFQDNVLFMKHNLNAQAIGSLKREFSTLRGEIDVLMDTMKSAIEASNSFIADLE